jgi:hypothetical protein
LIIQSNDLFGGTMAKYDPLRDYLKSRPPAINEITLSFDLINEMLESNLPYSAYNHSAWWANEVNGPHVQAHAWQDAGWKAEAVDFSKRRVRFIRVSHS